ncbi:MAG: efflux RND transporter periplasmic adaptor subunit [Chitinophagales bacterium]|nr:efflux RND transporter periplasmic adaptor subunit [Chitinophagales bacterium]
MSIAKRYSVATIIAFVIFVGSIFLLSSCISMEKDDTDANVYYTCSMDPQVHEQHPGKCPICHMELTKVEMSPEDMNEVKLSAEQMRLGNIHTDTMKLQNVSDEKILNGTAVINAQNVQQISSRISGRIDHLYFKNTGEVIHKGDHLYDIFSQELQAAQQEFLLAIAKKKTLGNNEINYEDLMAFAKNKLLLAGMSEKQIEPLQSSGTVQLSVPVYSLVNGTITNALVHEGDYVNMGSELFELADLSSLWIEAQVYSNQVDMLHNQEYAEVKIAAFPNEIIKGKIDFENPELVAQSEINLVRIKVLNPTGKYQPGMMAYVVLRGKNSKSFLIPSDAVMHDSKNSWVWIKNQKENFEIRMINTGISRNDSTEIISAINEGDIVVTSGAYLINSEYTFRNGTNPLQGMNMPNMKM